MINLGIILLLVWLHFLGDFILQSSYVATNKSKSNTVLLQHVLLYSLPLYIVGWQFALVNLVLHFVVDWCTSRVTSKLWFYEDKHWFFVVIGFDQALHLTCLATTYYWLYV